jgi:hypothetical protein
MKQFIGSEGFKESFKRAVWSLIIMAFTYVIVGQHKFPQIY